MLLRRYAYALLAREEALLSLAELADSEEADAAARELQATRAGLPDVRQDAEQADADLARLQAEGPAAHRRKDPLDKVSARGPCAIPLGVVCT